MTTVKHHQLTRQTIARLVLAGASLALLATAALARTIPASSARLETGEDPTCYLWFPVSGSSTGLQRTCTGIGYLDIAIPVDTAGSKLLTVYAYRALTSQQVSCNAIAITKTGGFVPGATVALTATPNGAFQPIVLPAISVAASGSLFVRCQLGQGTRVMAVEIVTP